MDGRSSGEHSAKVTTESEFEASMQNLPEPRLLDKETPALKVFVKEHGLSQPIKIRCSVLAGCLAKRCFVNVERQIRLQGGAMRTGWIFWQMDGVSISTEAHAVWFDFRGQLWDITPHERPAKRVAFSLDERVLLKRGYTKPFKTVFSGDPNVIAVEKFVSEINRLSDEKFVGINQEVSWNLAEIDRIGGELGLPAPLAKAIFLGKTGAMLPLTS
jgi:hypothetical protein